MKSSYEDYAGLKGVYLIKKNKKIYFQQKPICEQNKNENKQFIDKPFHIQYKNEVERG